MDRAGAPLPLEMGEEEGRCALTGEFSREGRHLKGLVQTSSFSETGGKAICFEEVRVRWTG